ncbi:hypothetical protein DN062_12295 [Nitrincola tibetensis]|uniref:Uncharacterized protein n=1 Tax=Nitrincola tibetensis TaxID=2219697 RepID=A0A364NK68_9GAMM|nr:hypothetical protein DN062_12295 [Nitrincola tibetensis]
MNLVNNKLKKYTGISVLFILTVCSTLFLTRDNYTAENIIGHIVISLIFNYQAIAFIFGWPMMTNTISLEKGKHDFFRVFLFTFMMLVWINILLN